jgi:hypothetical protein
MEEIWKSVNGYDGFYEVSNQGRVRSVNRVIIQPLKGVNTAFKYKSSILKGITDSGGYPLVGLSINRKHKSIRIHRLVAVAFLPNPENKKTVNHIDGNKQNNNDWNLEWATQLENNQHAINTGIGKRTSRKGKPHKCTIYQYDLNGNYIQNWESASFAAKSLGFHRSCISKCVLGKMKTSYGFIWKIKRESF